MFTGIIEEQGVLIAAERGKMSAIFKIRAKRVLKGTKPGDSIAVNGCCLTVTRRSGNLLSFDLMKETLTATTLGALPVGSKVNLERAMRADGRFGGHFVTGHVDGVATLRKIVRLKDYVEFVIAPPRKFMKYLVPKGSITIDGVSLTVGRVSAGTFSVYLIPATIRITTFGAKKSGDLFNIETDILARYLLKE